MAIEKFIAYIACVGPKHLFMKLGKLAANRDFTMRKHVCHRLQRSRDAAGAFVKHQHGIEPGKRLENFATLRILAREKAAEVKTRITEAAGHIRRRGSRRPRKHGDVATLRLGRLYKTSARVGNARHTRVAAKRYDLALGDAASDARGFAADGGLVQTFEPLLYAEVRKQLPRHARIFGTHHVRFAQLVERAQGHIPQIPDRRRTYDKPSRHSNSYLRTLPNRTCARHGLRQALLPAPS